MFIHYLKTAWRNLINNKVYSFINITGLALSLAAVWFIALFIAGEVSYDRYHKNADRVYRLTSHGNWETEKFDIAQTSALTGQALKNEFPEVEETVRLNPEGGGIISYKEKHFKEDAVFFTDSTFFKIFSYHFLAGDSASPLSKPDAVVITKKLCDKLFPNPEAAINQIIYFDNNFSSSYQRGYPRCTGKHSFYFPGPAYSTGRLHRRLGQFRYLYLCTS